MSRARSASADDGSAVIEFIVIGVCVLVPMIYVVLSVMAVQTAAFASTQAVREAGRAFSTATSAGEGSARAAAAARLAFDDHGLLLPAGALRIRCADGPCLAPGSAVDVSLDWTVALPWLPEQWSGHGSGKGSGQGSAGIPISASQRVPIDDYRSSPSGG